jgi:hypothetical protein
MADKPATEKCPECWNGPVVDSADTAANAAWDAALDLGDAAPDAVFARIAARYPRAVRDCPRCGGSGRLPG